jgi:hypothetical protein
MMDHNFRTTVVATATVYIANRRTFRAGAA